jgi:diguanylate cyclase (GGDEF)-like protein
VTDWDDTTSIADSAAINPPRGGEERTRAYLIVLAGSNVGEMFKVEQEELVLGRGGNADIRLLDDGISRLHCRVRLIPEGLQVEDLKSRNGTFCNGEKLTSRIIHDGDKLQLGRTSILKFTYQDQVDELFQQHMLDSALRDGLTHAYNKRYFVDRLNSEFRFAVRHRTPLALLILDLDHFKGTNDQFGHLAGDRVLVGFADHVQRSIRNEDVFSRYGGEEFAVISRAISRTDAKRFAERLRYGIEHLKIVHEGVQVPVTCSIGIATLPEDVCENPEDLVETADRALYLAKEGGRNRVCFSKSADDTQ